MLCSLICSNVYLLTLFFAFVLSAFSFLWANTEGTKSGLSLSKEALPVKKLRIHKDQIIK